MLMGGVGGKEGSEISEPGWKRGADLPVSRPLYSGEDGRVSDELFPHWALSGKTAALKGFPVWITLSGETEKQ